MSNPCSIIIPVRNLAGLTRQCLDAILAEPQRADFQIIVVDDASTDSTGELLASYGDTVRAITRGSSGGFAAACNDGAAVAGTEYLVFLNNDTVPQAGWLDALVDYADRHSQAAVVGSKLLFPNDTVQHAGVIICQDGYPRHLYAGFPADHPAVNKSRRLQVVTCACALVRRQAFEEVGAFDASFRNGLEDVDLCLRLGQRGYEIHYCHESVLYHLQSVSRPRNSKENERNTALYRNRWLGRVMPDDISQYLQDGTLRLRYHDQHPYPLRLELSPLLAVVDAHQHVPEAEQVLDMRSRQVVDLLSETARLTAHIADLELGRDPAIGSPKTERNQGDNAKAGTARLRHSDLSKSLREIEMQLYNLQSELTSAMRDADADNGASGSRAPEGFTASEYLGYRKLLNRLQEIVRATIPSGTTVVVLSRGDDELLELDGRRGWHFPLDEEGRYAGSYPANSAEAVAHLEELRAKGADYLLFPRPSFWWLDHYPEFRRHLEANYPTVVREDDCLIFALRVA
jgi:GT2 family glycosyltransferase